MVLPVIMTSKMEAYGGGEEGLKPASLLSLHPFSLLLAEDGEKDGLSSSDASGMGLRKEKEGSGGLLL